MPILDRKRVRPDILKIQDDMFNDTMKIVFQFTALEENKPYNFQEIYKKAMDLNELFFKREKGAVELHDLLTDEERDYLTRLLRYAFDNTAKQELEKFPIASEIEIKPTMLEIIPAEWIIPPNSIEDHVILHIHGGGWILGSPAVARKITAAIAKATKLKILSIDYRLAPEYPFPASLDDCVTAYKWLLSNGFMSENIIIAGESAGGNLTLATLLKLRDQGIELPAGAICLSPATDLTLSDDSFFENGPTDPGLSDMGLFWWVVSYLAGEDPHNPYVSPLHGDLNGLPPILIQVSTCEMLYSDASRFVEKAKKAGVNATLQAWDDMLHVFQQIRFEVLPESEEAINKIAEFTNDILKTRTTAEILK
ncbi:MAG: alpha/beta hydrolase [Promethearchaeota archaeon]|jgi:acetyl esterase/lipase